MSRFATQYDGFPLEPQLHHISENDCAVPDLTYSIKELREKFVLQTEVLKSQMQKPGDYLIREIDENNENEAFDIPSVEVPRNNDLVDMHAIAHSVSDARITIARLRDEAAKKHVESQQTQTTGTQQTGQQSGVSE